MSLAVTVNGETRLLEPGATVAMAVATVVSADRGVAVAVNGDVVPRSGWSRTVVAGDRIEVLTAVQGG